MYLWRKAVAPKWIESHQDVLGEFPPGHVALIERPARKRITVEISGLSGIDAQSLQSRSGGVVEKLPHDWLRRFAKAQKREPLRVGKRLVVLDVPVSPRKSGGVPPPRTGEALVIPSGAAFGTGDHATTAMSLRLLEEITRSLGDDWTFADLGTGSGILSLAAVRFGAATVIALDHDATAISTARENARLNRVGKIHFAVQDAEKWRAPVKFNVIAANLFSGLLVRLLPGIRNSLQPGGTLILSGVLRREERILQSALKRNRFVASKVRRRGKWLALSGQFKRP